MKGGKRVGAGRPKGEPTTTFYARVSEQSWALFCELVEPKDRRQWIESRIKAHAEGAEVVAGRVVGVEPVADETITEA